jgi:hypothetical protein
LAAEIYETRTNAIHTERSGSIGAVTVDGEVARLTDLHIRLAGLLCIVS